MKIQGSEVNRNKYFLNLICSVFRYDVIADNFQLNCNNKLLRNILFVLKHGQVRV